MTEPTSRADGAGTDDDAFTAAGAGPPPERIVRAFGVEYAHVRPPEGGDLFVTRFGWPDRDALMPARWYVDQWYAAHGEKLAGATGQVYRVRPRPGPGRVPDLLVKFSRVAQDVPIVAEASFPAEARADLMAEARFNSPMEEFGLVSELRDGAFGPPGLRVLTQRPLAVYAPPEAFDLWQMGRSASTFHQHNAMLAEDQGDGVKAIELDIRRIYVVIYGWLSGLDAEACFLAGELPEKEFLALTPRVLADLDARGFRVLDNKPKHYILRPRAGGGFLRRKDGELAYGLVDFELLQRTVAHQNRYHSERRARYWRMQSCPSGPAGSTEAPRSHLRSLSVFGVDYRFGPTPDGGRLWVVGREDGLFDYFLPDRWRRTPRVKLSVTGEVYRTGTRDHVDIVYRRSRVGFRPRVDPLSASSRAIRDSGYNSPFEEVAIAERLRQMGIATIWPRAIFHTGHQTAQSPRLRDPRRFTDHAGYVAPGDPPEAVLADGHDYYTIWDLFRGADPPRDVGRDAARGAVALQRASDDGLITAEEMGATLERVRERLAALGLPAGGIAGDEFVVPFDDDGRPERTATGELELRFSLDALTAYEFGLLEEREYLGLIARTNDRLRTVDFEALEPSGRHQLLSLDGEGRILRDGVGEIRVTLCHFSLLRPLYRPLR
jgi:hypothetical protein